MAQRGRADDAAESAAVFAFLWAMATLFQLLSTTWWAAQLGSGTLIGWVESALALAALWVLRRPAALRPFVAMLLLELWDVWLNLPVVPNHRLLSALVNLTILVALLRLAVSRRREPLAGAALFRAWAPVVRWELLLLYGFAVLHKLNHSFLDASVSCAAAFYGHIGDWLRVLPRGAWVDHGVIGATLLLEATIPLLLISRRTRGLGIVVSALFHFVLALDLQKHFLDFSATIYALLFLFAPDDFPQQARAWWGASGLRARVVARGLRPVRLLRATLLTLLPGIAVAGFFYQTAAGFLLFFVGRQLLWVVYALLLVALFLRVSGLGSARAAPPRALLTLTRLSPAVVLLLFLLNGFSPYLGLKNRSAFDMYSNLRVADTQSNHFLFPTTLDLLGRQNDLVTLRASSDPTLQGYAEEGWLLPFFEFRAFLSAHPDVAVRYRFEGPGGGAAPRGGRPRARCARAATAAQADMVSPGGRGQQRALPVVSKC